MYSTNSRLSRLIRGMGTILARSGTVGEMPNVSLTFQESVGPTKFCQAPD